MVKRIIDPEALEEFYEAIQMDYFCRQSPREASVVCRCIDKTGWR